MAESDDPAPRKTLIRFESVSKRFGGMAAVDDVSLEVLEGEIFCLLGPSGCGKSTLLRCLAGFEPLSGGRILLDGSDLDGTPPHRRPLNMMFQSYALFPHLSVGGNVAYGLKRAGMSRSAIAARVAELLALVRLDGFERRRPDQLSGGQRQRVALARALARRPRVLLLDEPLGALDRKLREETQLELRDLQARLGTTFVVVTHDQAEAMTLADRIGIMDRGRLVQVGSPADLYDRPETSFVAAFLGDVNLISARREGAGTFATPAGPAAVAEGGPHSEVTLAVRPEHVRLHLQPPPAPNAWEARVAEAVYLGDRTLYRLTLPHGEGWRATSPEPGPRRGDRVWLTFDPARVRVLTG